DDVSPQFLEFDGAGEGAIRVGVFATVRKGIGREVQDAHQDGALAKHDLALLELPVVDLSHCLQFRTFGYERADIRLQPSKMRIRSMKESGADHRTRIPKIRIAAC